MRLALFAALLSAPAAAADIVSELAQGPLVQVKAGADGKFVSATALVLINAPPAEVWKVITDFAHYAEFLAKILSAKASVVSPDVTDVEMEVDNPGPNTVYTARVEMDPAGLRTEARQVAGDLEGSTWGWELSAAEGGRTLARYRNTIKNFSSLAEKLEDDQQTVTVGINVMAAIQTVRAVKVRVEKQRRP